VIDVGKGAYRSTRKGDKKVQKGRRDREGKSYERALDLYRGPSADIANTGDLKEAILALAKEGKNLMGNHRRQKRRKAREIQRPKSCRGHVQAFQEKRHPSH